MAFVMAHPWKHPGTGIYYLRNRTPLDLLPKVKGRTVTLPIDDQTARVRVGAQVKVSLRTKEIAAAKMRFVKANGALEAFWEAVRNGPISLTNKEVWQLAARMYHDFVEFEDVPGSPGMWEKVIEFNNRAKEEDRDLNALADSLVRSPALERNLGSYADKILSDVGTEADEESRWQLVLALNKVSNDIAEKLKRNAEGDYRPDPNATRYPKIDNPIKRKQTDDLIPSTITGLFENWAARKKLGGGAEASVRRWNTVVTQFVAFLGHDNASEVVRDDVIRWREQLFLTKQVSIETFRKSNRAALNAVFALGVDLGAVDSNPVASVKPERSKRAMVRPKAFLDDEVRLILKAALEAPERPGREQKRMRDARRWVPWICAYSGARVSEITQLRKEDFITVQGISCIRITPEAGTVKDKEARVVPLHPHLVAQGLLAFVKKSGQGPLFYNPKSKQADPAQRVSNRLAEWVRSSAVGITDANVQPNHGWRHRFKNVCARAGVDERTANHITGHAQSNEGNAYGHGEVSTMYEAIKKLARIDA